MIRLLASLLKFAIGLCLQNVVLAGTNSVKYFVQISAKLYT